MPHIAFCEYDAIQILYFIIFNPQQSQLRGTTNQKCTKSNHQNEGFRVELQLKSTSFFVEGSYLKVTGSSFQILGAAVQKSIYTVYIICT